MNEQKENYNVICCNGGKDSVATCIIAKNKGIKIDEIIFSLPFFDKKKQIYADNPNHIKWLFSVLIPTLKTWGFKTTILSGDKDYKDKFYHVVKKSKKPERNGKYSGWLISGMCAMNGQKVEPIKKYIKSLKTKYNVVEFVGIAINEKPRIERMINRGQRSLLCEENYTNEDAFQIVSNYQLLSPNYLQGHNVRGCWFCPNAHISEFIYLYHEYPELYNELLKLNKEKNKVREKFSRSLTFEEIDNIVRGK